MMRDLKPLPDRDPARATLAAAIALEAGARREMPELDRVGLGANDGREAQRTQRGNRPCALDQIATTTADPRAIHDFLL